MELKQVVLNNRGMHQDLSISKETQDYAYKNLNIRIQATSDGTLASVTNIKSPKLIDNTTMRGKVLNSILCGEYLVVFTHDVDYDYIYRIDLENNCITRELYKGNLNFKNTNPIDSTFYFENSKVQKVYWVDGWTPENESQNGDKDNPPRVINIITEGERNNGNFSSYPSTTNFDFYPEIDGIPTISAEKNFDVYSEIPSGTTQYFVSYFNYNNSETAIAATSSLFTVDAKNKGLAADKTGCAFDITLSNVSTSYEYIRLYAARRTSVNGEIILNIVKDSKITPGVTTYTFLDNGVNQEILDSTQIFFVGGTPLFAKTLCQKDNTLFLGGIKTKGIILNQHIRDTIAQSIIERDGIQEANIVYETRKTLPSNGTYFGGFYPYKLQKDNESELIKTYKVGEIYRFGIQFQTKSGQWSEVLWIGDRKIENKPQYNVANDTFSVSNIATVPLNATLYSQYDTFDYHFKQYLLAETDFINYRLLMADTEGLNSRSIVAQGVVCPTLFSPNLRTNNSPHTINSWIMRPRKGTAPYHHLEPLHPAIKINSELSTYDPNETIDSSDNRYHTMPFEFIPYGTSVYEKASKDNNFYIDESIVNLYSPEINDTTTIKGHPKFRIIGTAPLKTNYCDCDVEVENVGMDMPYTPYLDVDVFKKYNTDDSSSSVISPLYSEFTYIAPGWKSNALDQARTIMSYSKFAYNIHMWQHSKSIIGAVAGTDKVELMDDSIIDLAEDPLVLKNNLFYNHLFSKYSTYFNLPIDYSLDFGMGIYMSDGNDVLFKDGTTLFYAGALDYIHSNEKTNIYRKNLDASEASQEIDLKLRNKEIPASSRITFDSIPHVVFYLGTDDNNKLKLLPRFNNETAYSGIFTGKYDVYNNTWKNIVTSASTTQAETNLKTLFNRNLNSVGSTLGAPWIENFAIYREGTVEDIYDQDNSKYKTCGAIKIPSGQGIAGTIRNYRTQLQTYNYTEEINNVTCYVLIALVEGGVKKCYWSVNDTEWSNITTVNPTDEELLKIYPVLRDNTGTWQTDVWEGNSQPSGGWYKFVQVSKEWDIFSNVYLYNFEIKNLSSFEAFSGDFAYSQETINTNSENVPYLFLGELYYDIPYSELYGGYTREALNKLNWIPISKITPISSAITLTEGDAYYQRWDCLKTFPKTEADMNRVVDITSFMVETHINLDDRYDPNRATFNTEVRPTNFNLFNPVYSSKNNLFTYSTTSQLFSEENPHQVIWSLTKNIIGTVDSWTNINYVNVTNLKYPITKLVNFNNKVVGLTEHSIELINYNARNMVPTDNNTFIELKNSEKVDGTINFSTDNGTRNKSVLITESGLYFIDDNENSLMRINYSGEIKNLGVGSIDSWFKNNITSGTYTTDNPQALRFAYDAKQKDVYICNDNTALVYNELLEAFTSFVDFQELVSLFTTDGNTYAIANQQSENVWSNDLFYLFGDSSYGYGFYDKNLPYSIQYRVNPGPYTDKVFTNIALKADLNVSSENKSKSSVQPFNKIRVWNEYQDTKEQNLIFERHGLYSGTNLQSKFRTWRAFIPRDKNEAYGRNRIRNPWIHLELKNTNVDGSKLEFHNIAVQYME